MKYILNKGVKVVVVPEGSKVDLSKDHPIIGTTKYGDLWSRDCVLKETSKMLYPSLSYNADLRITTKYDLEQEYSDEVLAALKQQDYEDRTDRLVAQLGRLEQTGGDAKKIQEVQLELKIANAEIQEKYGAGEVVYITGTGSCYHVSESCSALANATSVNEVAKSQGLKNYNKCSVCCE